MAAVGLNAVVGRPKSEYGCEPLAHSDMRPGCYDVKARIEDMNANGILASLNFPTVVKFDGQVFAGFRNKAHAISLLQAYNDWYIDEWCGSYPGRSIPMALIPYWDVEASVDEIKRMARKGCHAINLVTTQLFWDFQASIIIGGTRFGRPAQIMKWCFACTMERETKPHIPPWNLR